MFFILPFAMLFTFLYVKANSSEIDGEIFLLRFKAKYRSRKNAWLPPFFFVDSNSFCKDLLFPHGPNMAQKPRYLVSTVLKLNLLNFSMTVAETTRVLFRLARLSIALVRPELSSPLIDSCSWVARFYTQIPHPVPTCMK